MRASKITIASFCFSAIHSRFANLLFRSIQRPFHSIRHSQPVNMSETFVVSTSYGPVRGNKRVSCVGDTFYSFRGIPYAKPPLGALRFKVGASHTRSPSDNCRASDVSKTCNLSRRIECLSQWFACVTENMHIRLNMITKRRILKFPSRGCCPGMRRSPATLRCAAN